MWSMTWMMVDIESDSGCSRRCAEFPETKGVGCLRDLLTELLPTGVPVRYFVRRSHTVAVLCHLIRRFRVILFIII